jgi:NADPH-dependent 2,4-dienoyl-CoA reductase/sulfur reductase-like enzyme
MEAARISAVAGHSVTLVESSSQFGGMIRTFARGNGRGRFALLAQWLEDECRRSGVTMRTGAAVDSQDLGEARRRGELVVVATGSAARPPTYPVDDSVRWLDASETFEKLSPVGPGPVVLIDPLGGPVAVALAEALAAQGASVSIVTPDSIVGSRLGASGDLVGANTRIQRAGITRVLASRVVEIASGAVCVEHVHTGERSQLECEVVIDCSPRLPNETLGEAADIQVGDSVAPRTVLESIREGRCAGFTTRTSFNSAERAIS